MHSQLPHAHRILMELSKMRVRDEKTPNGSTNAISKRLTKFVPRTKLIR